MGKFMCEVCLEKTNFKRTKMTEKISIRGLEISVPHEYDECLKCNELFEPHEDIDKNIKKDYEVYRETVGYLQPTEVKKIREKYDMTVREFASVLGIGYSTLSNIENGALQNDYQNALFEFSSSPSAMYKHTIKRKNYIEEDISDEIIQTIEQLCIEEEPHLQDLRNRVNQTLDRVGEQSIHITQKFNFLEYEINQLVNENKVFKEKEVDKKWTGVFQNILPQS